MTLIEFYLKKYLNTNNKNVLLELRNYLVDNGYELDLGKMLKNRNRKIYLYNHNHTCKIKYEMIIDDDDTIVPSIVMVEKSQINDESSPFNNYRAIKDITYRLDTNEIIVYYSLFPKDDYSNGYWAKIYFKNNELVGEIVSPKFIKLDLIFPYIDLPTELYKNHILLIIMSKIIEQIPIDYFKNNKKDDKNKEIVKQP